MLRVTVGGVSTWHRAETFCDMGMIFPHMDSISDLGFIRRLLDKYTGHGHDYTIHWYVYNRRMSIPNIGMMMPYIGMIAPCE